MQSDAAKATPGQDHESNALYRFNVVILYDGAGAGRRAMNQLQTVTELLEEDLDLQVRLWRLDVLMEATDSTTAAADLAGADLLVLALDVEDGVNASIRARLRQAVHQMRGKGTALAILTNDDATTVSSQFHFLQQAAEEAGVGFLFPPASRAPAGTESPFSALHRHVPEMTPLLGEILKDNQSRPRWE